MTAVEKHVRLQAIGLWREHPEVPPREVIVAFGNATLVLKDLDERPLGHWALAGLSPTEQEGPATVYAMSADGGETLAIRDPEMIAAIAAVARPSLAPAPLPASARPRRRRLPVLSLLLVAAAVGGAILAAPRVIGPNAALLVPPERAAEFGDRMLIALIGRQGPLCYDPAGQAALGALAARLAPESPPRLRVLELGDVPVAALPGGTLLLDRALVDDAPEAVAGWAAVGLARDPVEALLRAAGPLADARYFLSGEFSEPALARAATAAVAAPPVPAEAAAALDRLAAAGVEPGPFAASLAAAGIAAPAPSEPAEAGPALDGRDRLALRGICG
jgi:hypothetical protein